MLRENQKQSCVFQHQRNKKFQYIKLEINVFGTNTKQLSEGCKRKKITKVLSG